LSLMEWCNNHIRLFIGRNKSVEFDHRPTG
jgi:hypothetical protein